MPTVTSFTAARLQDLEDGTVIDGSIDGAGHLILVTKDGTQIDAGAYPSASLTTEGVIELATAAEVLTGTDALRAVTPLTLASVPGTKVQIVSGIGESASPTSYPVGLSIMSVTSGSGWTPNGGFGTIVTNNISVNRCQQTFYSSAGGINPPLAWIRSHNNADGGGGWTGWHQQDVRINLTPGSFTQATALANYPIGWSRLYYTSGSVSWDFSGKAGEVSTYRVGNDFARQTWIKHQGGVGGETEIWLRTATLAGSWSPWRIIVRDAKLPDPQVVMWNTSQTVSATTDWADLPNLATINLTLAYPAIVQVEFGAWLLAPTAATMRAGISHNGAAPQNLFGGTWGNVLYTAAGNDHYAFSASSKLAAGAHSFKARAYNTGATGNVNYSVLRVTPTRWAD